MKQDFFRANRKRLTEGVKGGVVVVTAYSQMQRGNDAAFQFEQESNFWWLTGVDSPDWQIIIDGTRGKSWLVIPHVSSTHQLFDGSLSADEALKVSGVEAVIDEDQATALLKELATKHSVVYTIGDSPYAKHFDFVINPAPRKLWKMLERIFNDVQDCRRDLAKLRAIKQPVEITAIKKAIKLTMKAFNDVKILLSDLTTEYEVEAEFTYAFRQAGATGHAYDPIVASGKNAVTLHYNANNERVKGNSLLLLDIGARVDGYSADITRTYAVGVPSQRQIEVHQAVEMAQKQIIALLRPELSVNEYEKTVEAIMRSALLGLGLLKKPEDYRRYFPHAISHGLGVDVHDSLGGPIIFLPGMVLTVEPGIYIPEEGIGVRIEDDILITPTGHTNLSSALPTSL